MHKYESTPYTPVAPISVGIMGARGYSGLELLRLCLVHPGIGQIICYASEGGFSPETYLPELSQTPLAARVEVQPTARLLDAVVPSTIFLATPAEVSLEWAPRLLDRGVHVIDLSGAYRLPGESAVDCRALYRDWYGLDHPAPALVARAEFGLSPFAELANREGPRLIANPGCFATSVLMALVPLLKAGAIEPATLVIDAKSGTTGGGRKAKEDLLFSEVDGEIAPYRVGRHQHLPEIRAYAAKFGQVELEAVTPLFATHLASFRRGIVASIYARPSAALRSQPAAAQSSAIGTAFAQAYADYPLVKIFAGDVATSGTSGTAGTTSAALAPRLRHVVGTARTHIHYQVANGGIYLFSLIDNLMKGAASQAIENWNRLTGWPVQTGLHAKEGVL